MSLYTPTSKNSSSDTSVTTSKNVIAISGYFSPQWLPRALSEIHKLVAERGHRDIVLDFSDCTGTQHPPMLAIAVKCQACWSDGVQVRLTLPRLPAIAKLFRNANWAHLIDPHNFLPAKHASLIHVPAEQFVSAEQQFQAVNKVTELVLGSVEGLKRESLTAFEWALNEITDNVLNHAQSRLGGFLQVTNNRAKKQIQFVVVDAGIGVAATLRQTHQELRSDSEALDRAIREGVTRDTAFGQGNGLFGSWRITQLSGGNFEVYSNRAKLRSDPKNGLRSSKENVPFNGTMVAATINFSSPIDIRTAFTFKGTVHETHDLLDMKYSPNDHGVISLSISHEARTLGMGTRQAGSYLRSKIEKLLEYNPTAIVSLDFSEVYIISSSFADEAIGKLFVSMGPTDFISKVRLEKCIDVVRSLIDRAIQQRVAASSSR